MLSSLLPLSVRSSSIAHHLRAGLFDGLKVSRIANKIFLRWPYSTEKTVVRKSYYSTNLSEMSHRMKKLPIGIQSIKNVLTNGDYIYIDKTDLAKQLIEESKHYLMSRPRRFGKSLFLNTLREIFSNNKDLFKGCKIYNSNYKWEQYPVIYLDFSQMLNTTPEQLEIAMQKALQDEAALHGVSIIDSSAQSLLVSLVEELSKKKRVVVLVDEYNQPIINNLTNPDIAEENKKIMANFLGTLKSLDRHLRFTFITGVSKFSLCSIFSGPNHLIDISMDQKYSSMMGYTEEEIRHCFSEHIKRIAEKRGQTEDAVMGEIREWYNGYRFSEKEVSVYNPYSTLRYLSSGEAEGYWYSSGSPSLLIDQIKKYPPSIIPIRGSLAVRHQLSDINRLDQIDLKALMFQTGYLTIKSYNEKEDFYSLDFPNKEVRQAFFDSLLTEFIGINPLEVSDAAEQIRKNLEDFDLESFVSTMNTHFAKIAYQQASSSYEGFYQVAFFTFLEKSGISTQSEIARNVGKIDLIAETPKAICIFDLKLYSARSEIVNLEDAKVPGLDDRKSIHISNTDQLTIIQSRELSLSSKSQFQSGRSIDKPANAAFSQAQAKKYIERYATRGKEILVMGMNFSSKSRNIESWKGAVYSSSGTLIRESQPKKADADYLDINQMYSHTDDFDDFD